MRHIIWMRVALLLATLFIVSGGVMTAAQGPGVGGGEGDELPLLGAADWEVVYPVQQNGKAVQPADAPAACTRIGFNGSLEGWTV
ncbi:MAG: hypothetical protein N2508_05000, partial [Anaerolineae bacterium]|nr:hypothetical protein [Anaerolineae bacterium]